MMSERLAVTRRRLSRVDGFHALASALIASFCIVKTNSHTIPTTARTHTTKKRSAMAGSSIVSFVCLVTCAYICVHEPHMSSAQMTGGHDAVEKKMCEDLPSICPCNARHLDVTAGSAALVCGASQAVASMATLPTIKPPTGVTLDQVFIIQICIMYALNMLKLTTTMHKCVY